MVFDVVEHQLAELFELDAVALGILTKRGALTYANGLRFPPPRRLCTRRRRSCSPGRARLAWGLGRSAMKRHHPHHEHLLLWYLAVDPSLQRQGIGRALLDQIRSETTRARRPIHLDTIKPENVPYYESQGYRQISHARLDTRSDGLVHAPRHARGRGRSAWLKPPAARSRRNAGGSRARTDPHPRRRKRAHGLTLAMRVPGTPRLSARSPVPRGSRVDALARAFRESAASSASA